VAHHAIEQSGTTGTLGAMVDPTEPTTPETAIADPPGGLGDATRREAAPSTSDSPTIASTPPATGRSSRDGWMIALVVAVVALLASQVYLIASLAATRDELASVSLDLNSVSSQVSGVDGIVFGINDKVDDVTARIDALEQGSPSSAAGIPEGVRADQLPIYSPGVQDQALGMTLGLVEGPDAYSGETLSIDPADGTKRIWMVWAHWCPYCQQELPSLADLHPAITDAYPGIEIATVTSSIDPGRGNPLDDYLAAEQFPFPVLVDEDLALAGQMGVNAFPFWVVTDGDGTVLLRMTGLMQEARFLELVESLDAYDA
jgi:thiol-disulfide isomerase/thioredoxin